MNLMYVIVNNLEYTNKNNTLLNRVNNLKLKIKKDKVKFSNNSVKIGDIHYYNNVLPLISKDRDVLKKPIDVCKMSVNWEKKAFKNMSTDDILKELKTQWGWSTTIVDAEHTRNKFKNKELLWVVFDTKEEAEQKMKLFNSMFITAIEQDCINEYKRFKENPDKRILTFDKLVENAYELYEAVDNNEF